MREKRRSKMSGKEGSWGACWVLVTGASRGLGAAICEGVAPLLGDGSRMVGVARTAGGLTSTEGQVKKASAKVEVMDFGRREEQVARGSLCGNLGVGFQAGVPGPLYWVSVGLPRYRRGGSANVKDPRVSSS
ncbi:hypothetical protein C7M84_007888 [Penaeus vannamei]|uniref:Uncharacterized protein n=1 Tax=Penaeus vannamei TaxID=6689 RepID=A0A423TB17_PENVA|nr:hypothetical protein C7M84_007888 [Penaeus vannamei]